MRHRPFPSSQAASAAGFLTFCAMGLYGILTWLDQPTGAFSDWVIGLVGLWWLLGVVTIPWNIYFSARQVARQVAESAERGVTLEGRAPALVRRIERLSLVGALGVHVASAVGFAALSATGWSQLGWIGCAAALALTVVRPAARGYAYVMDLLGETSQRVRFPADDVAALKERLERAEQALLALRKDDPDSWASEVERRLTTADGELDGLRARLAATIEDNHRAHESLSREAGRIKERVSEDIQSLGHVREIVQFIKSA